MEKIEIGFAPKTVELGNGLFLHFWYANNRGRGDDNCTIIKSSNAGRARVSAKQENVIEKTRTSSWNGHVNFSCDVKSRLGIE